MRLACRRLSRTPSGRDYVTILFQKEVKLCATSRKGLLRNSYLLTKGLSPRRYDILRSKYSSIDREVEILRNDWEKFFKSDLYYNRIRKLINENNNFIFK